MRGHQGHDSSGDPIILTRRLVLEAGLAGGAGFLLSGRLALAASSAAAQPTAARNAQEKAPEIAINAWLEERSTPTIRIPAVTAATMNAWQNLERQLERFVPLDEVRESGCLHDLSRMELDHFRNRFLVQFEDWADWILPDPSLIKNRATRTSGRKANRVNPLTNRLLRPRV